MEKEGQVSIEVMFTISILLIIFTLSLLFVYTKKHEIQDTSSFIEEKNECFRIANAINYLNVNGHGTRVRLETDYVVQTYNNTIVINKLKNVTTTKNNIAILASTFGTTRQSLYDAAETKFNPDWYHNCNETQGFFTESLCRCKNGPNLDSCDPGSSSEPPEVDFRTLKWNYTWLMKNISHYNTIYLEDAHTLSNITYNGRNFTDIIEEWVANGGVLMLSEHFMCRNFRSGCYNPNFTDTDTWYNILGVNFYQTEYGGDYYWSTVLINDPYFPKAPAGTQYRFEEGTNVILDYKNNNDAQGLIKVATNNTGGVKDATNPAGQPTIAHWRYGSGQVFWFSDFNTGSLPNNFEELIVDLVQDAYLQFISIKDEPGTLCKSELRITDNYIKTGNLELENVYGEVKISNYV